MPPFNESISKSQIYDMLKFDLALDAAGSHPHTGEHARLLSPSADGSSRGSCGRIRAGEQREHHGGSSASGHSSLLGAFRNVSLEPACTCSAVQGSISASGLYCASAASRNKPRTMNYFRAVMECNRCTFCRHRYTFALVYDKHVAEKKM